MSTVSALFKRPPDFVIGDDPTQLYLRRWWVIPRNHWFNIYWHEILRSDTAEALHDHPWWNVSIIFSTGYFEVIPFPIGIDRGYISFDLPIGQRRYWRGPGRVIFRRAASAHRLEVLPGGVPTYSLFITGPIVREWGFHCPNGWRHWKDFVANGVKGKIGKGCGD